ncbi:RNA polymerase sigma factor [Desertivirga arenae]|uniref:RNA polymerase sigma factor n=1 Tax=Desertivirga arenae TaxID=2810309 RepID=UPI001A958E91|nr:sigma-70 family RNA polymerase sigma factor [Pedobacter sp. SYSU D00823]
MRFIRHKTIDPKATEADLLAHYKNSGDLEVLGRLYERYMPLLYGLCLKYFKDEELSKDAVMQIFEQLIKKLKVHEVSNFKSWLYTLARNYCLMELRVTGKHEFVNLDDAGLETPYFQSAEGDDLTEMQLKQMGRCLEKLPTEQKVCVELFYLQQKCYKEVTDITGFDANKVKSYIQNGKRNLKICMEKNSGNE